MTDGQDHVRFVLLGPVRVLRASGEAMPVGPPQQRLMLAALALAPGEALSLARLTDALWDDAMPATAMSTVRTYAWRLRRLLADAGGSDGVLESAGDGYRLAVDRSVVDVSRVEHLAMTAREELTANNPHQARLTLVEALDMWAGEALAGLPGLFAERNRLRLIELRITLMEQLLETELRLGRHEEAYHRITELIDENPLRERPYALLMRALYGMSRQVEALEVFRNARNLLIETHGVEPGAELVEAHERILRGDTEDDRTETHRRSEAGSATVSLGKVVPAQLPPALNVFIGRSKQKEQLEAVLTAPDRRTPAVLAIVGMGGIGKTSLALHVAHRVRGHYPDGQLHVDLGDPDVAGDPLTGAETTGQLLAGLGVPAAQIPENPSERRGLLRSLVAGRRLLILLDNASYAGQILDALPGAPGCAVVVTSRTRLVELPLSVQVTLEVFDVEESLDLLRQGIGEERMAAELADAVDMVAACGHLPLAIRVLASRLASRPRRTLRSMVERLADVRSRLAELRSGSLAVDAAFEVGYRQLPAQLAQDFVLLAAVAGAEFAMPEAAAVLDLEQPGAELRLESLVDAALLSEPYPGRFQFHALLYSFALGVERDREADGPALDRLLGQLMCTARRAFELAVPGDPAGDALSAGSATAAEISITDLRAARRWVIEAHDIVLTACTKAADSGAAGLVGIAIDLLIALSPFGDEMHSGGRLASAARSLSEATARLSAPAPGTGAHQRLVGRVEFLLSTIALQRGSPDETEQHARRAVDAAAAAEDSAILRQALNDLGLVYQLRHEYGLAMQCFDRATELARELGHRSGEVSSGVNAALARLRGGNADRAGADGESALALAQELGDDLGISHALYVLGLAKQAQGRHGDAVEQFSECAELCIAAGIRDREAHARYRLAGSLLALDRVGDALVQAELALARCEELGAERDQAQSLMVLGRSLVAAGRAAEAVERFARAQTIYARLALPEEADAAEAVVMASAASEV